MSSSGGPTRTGTLRAEAGLGVAIRVTDGQGREVGSGVAELELTVAEGLYAVGWLTAGSTTETVVRVAGGGETVALPPQTATRPTRGRPADVFAIMVDGHTASDGEEFLSSRRSGTTDYIDRSSLIVDIVDADGEPTGDMAGALSVFDGFDREVSAIDPALFPPDAGGTAAWADVTPGRYRLRYAALSGETLDQVIPVLKDRTTMVRLQAARATVLVHGSEGFTSTRTSGIDPTRTVISTSSRTDTRERIDEQEGLCGLLLRDLAGGTSSLSRAFFERLAEQGTDPLLRVYAALVVLNCLELDVAPALDEEWRDDPRLLRTATHEWARRAASLLDRAKRVGMPPDAIVGLWQAERLLGADVKNGSSKASASIRMPPMFECAWRWAVARSTVDRNALQDFASIRAAAKSAGGTAPWLCWSAAAAKALQNPAPAASDDELDALLQSVVQKMRRLRQQQERTTSALILPHSLPAEAVATALRAEQVVERPGKGRDDFDTPVAALAVALTLPLAALAARLALTDQALDEALAQDGGERSRRASDREADAPGWRKKVKFKDDPNRGRFGGAAERDGFRLVAEFNHTNSKNWVTIHLSLVGPAGFDGTAVIYLHNSYKPPRYDYRFRDGIVRDRLTAWGGFTVGAWIPSHRIELELNLAAVDGAPTIIRER